MERKKNVLEELSASDVPRDPLISPMYATDEMLRQLPPTFLIVSYRAQCSTLVYYRISDDDLGFER